MRGEAGREAEGDVQCNTLCVICNLDSVVLITAQSRGGKKIVGRPLTPNISKMIIHFINQGQNNLIWPVLMKT